MTLDTFTIDGDILTVQDLFAEKGWTDGLPIVPPTSAAVGAMVRASGEAPDSVIGVIPPLGATVTLDKVAANAVMAGCRPDHFRSVLAAIRALLVPKFNLYLIQTTTHPATPLVILHGPEARRIGVNGKTGVFGPGFVANAAIGRAVRLVLMNLGDGRPAVRDWSTQGSPAKFAFCITENAEESPWPEFHTTRGLKPDSSAVTVVAVEGPQCISDHQSTTPERMLDLVADTMGRLGSNNWFASNGGSDVVVVLSPEHAALAGNVGWTRADVQQYLYHRCIRPSTDMARGGMWQARTWAPWLHALAKDPSATLPIVEKADDIMVLVAGGPGRFSSVMTTMGNVSRSVTIPIAT